MARQYWAQNVVRSTDDRAGGTLLHQSLRSNLLTFWLSLPSKSPSRRGSRFTGKFPLT